MSVALFFCLLHTGALPKLRGNTRACTYIFLKNSVTFVTNLVLKFDTLISLSPSPRPTRLRLFITVGVWRSPQPLPRVSTFSPKSRQSPRTVDADVPNSMNNSTLRSPGDDGTSPRQCLVCCEPTTSSTSLTLPSCSHTWCYACIFRRFSAAIENETNYPVICCSAQTPVILSPAVDTVIGRYMTSLFLAKKTEYDTQDKTYCHVPSCSNFISPGTIRVRQATCKSCKADTCSECKKAYHGTTACQKVKKEDDQFEAWCEDKKTRKCPRCERVVERISGW